MNGPLDTICWSMYDGCICGLEPGHDGDHECLSETHEPEHWTTEQGHEWMDKITKGDREQQPERTPEMIANHQHWVWLAGANPPHWEVRGTGVVR